MSHDNFMKFFLGALRLWLSHDIDNTYANAGLKFLAKYLTSQALQNDDESNELTENEPQSVFQQCFQFLLETTSPKNLIRIRMCQFVNMILDSLGGEAELDENLCVKIQESMTKQLKDHVGAVRVESARALQRLQEPSNRECPVVGLYIFHMQNDPVVKVRQTIISALCRTKRTVPYIVERLWDIDASVRRYCIMRMSSYPVKMYTIQQRIDFLSQGFSDRSKTVRQVC